MCAYMVSCELRYVDTFFPSAFELMTLPSSNSDVLIAAASCLPSVARKLPNVPAYRSLGAHCSCLGGVLRTSQIHQKQLCIGFILAKLPLRQRSCHLWVRYRFTARNVQNHNGMRTRTVAVHLCTCNRPAIVQRHNDRQPSQDSR